MTAQQGHFERVPDNQARAAEVLHLLDASGGARDVKEAVISVALDDADKRHEAVVREATDLCWKATPFTEDEEGCVAAYLLPAGVVHRLLGALQGAGYPAAFRAPDRRSEP